MEARIDTLPVELGAYVASFLPDPRSLINLAVTCKQNYGVVKLDEAALASSTEVITQLKDSGLLSLSLAVLKSWDGRSPSQTIEGTIRFIDDHFSQGAAIQSLEYCQKMTLGDCVRIYEFHNTVERYAAIIARMALEEIHSSVNMPQACSTTEIHRIKKSLYLSQLLRNLFPRNYHSPTGVADQLSSQPAWKHLWSKFAPWELQQVRCTEHLLANYVGKLVNRGKYIINIFDSNIHRANSYIGHRFDIRILWSFVSSQGPLGLTRLDGPRSENSMLLAVRNFQKSLVSSSYRDPWYLAHDTMWLRQNGILTNFHTRNLLRRYQEAESGPQDAWLHTLLQPHVDDVMFINGADGCFQCDHHATLWGFVFWDRQRLDAITKGTLPTTVQMNAVSNFSLETEEMLFHARLRQDKLTCSCSFYDDDSDY